MVMGKEKSSRPKIVNMEKGGEEADRSKETEVTG
jgi:hypothetical protein